jgi:protein-cysteine N-palmitoyltransferase HHAT
MFIWLKFNFIWKFARCWALWDGIESYENMVRCMNNNYSFEGFWRSWHRSFNQWLIRYLFVPLGRIELLFFDIEINY